MDSFVHDCVVSSFGKNVYQHRQGVSFVKQLVFGADDSLSRNRVAFDNRHKFAANFFYDPDEQVGLFQFVAVEPFD